MSTNPSDIPQGDPLAGMEDGEIVINDVLKRQAEEPEAQPEPTADTSNEADAAEGENDAGEGDKPEEKPKKNKIPREQRIRELLADNKVAKSENETLQARIAELEKRLTPPENPGNIPDNRDPEPDPTDLSKYRLGDLDPAYTRDLVRWELRQEFRNEQAAAAERQAAQEAQARQREHASEVLGKVADIEDKGLSLHPDYKETVVEPFMSGEIPLEEATFLAATEVEHGSEVLRELALNRAEAARVASMTPIQQGIYVTRKSDEIAARNKPRLPQAGAPPSSVPRGTGGRLGIRGDTESVDDIEKFLYRRG